MDKIRGGDFHEVLRLIRRLAEWSDSLPDHLRTAAGVQTSTSRRNGNRSRVCLILRQKAHDRNLFK
jgi:hypothetical protein